LDLKTASISLVAFSLLILFIVAKFDMANLKEKHAKEDARVHANIVKMEEDYRAKLAEVALEKKSIKREVEVKKEVLEKKFDEKSMSAEHWRQLNDESRAYHVEKMRMLKEHVQECFETFIKNADEYLAKGDYKNAAGFANACIKLKPEDNDAKKLKARIDSFRVVNKLGMAFINIPKGEFKMGSLPSEKGRAPDEDMHKVLITNNFYLMETEVTQEQWDAVMNSPNGEIREFSKVVTPALEKGANLPVENISFNDINSFLAKINQMKIGFFRLPTEAEWEYAARANEKGAFGDYESPHATTWFSQNSTRKSQPVRTRFSNNFGLFDMLGNVSEWVSDYYALYPGDPLVAKADPKVTENTGFRVYRGGSFKDSEAACRIANRNKAKDDFVAGSLGFRLVYQAQ
jgi:formylglycine-generating enzyme required for sulfatase activity